MNDRSSVLPLWKGLSSVAALAAATVLSGSAVAASFGSLPIELAWEAPESCPPSDDIEGDVRRLLGSTPLPESLPPISARVSVRELGQGGFEVRVRTTSGGEERERELRTESCEEARRLVAFLLAFLIDPRALEQSVTEAPPKQGAPAAASSPPVPAPPRVLAPAARRQEPADDSPRWIASASAGADLGVLPSVSLGGELRFGLRFAGWSVEGRAAGWLPRRTESSSVAGAGGELTLFDAGLLGCLRSPPWEAPSIQVCSGPVLLWLRGKGYGVLEPGREEAVFAGAEVQAALLVALSAEVSLRPALGALVPLRRPTFAIRGVGPIHRPNAAAARASLGFEVAF